MDRRKETVPPPGAGRAARPPVLRRLWKRPATLLIHISFVVIIVGALLTHFRSEESTLHLREGETAGGVTLVEFRVETYPGTSTPMDFVSVLRGDGRTVELRMNSTVTLGGWRLMQREFDSDGHGVVLKRSRDLEGTAVTFAGYIMLALSMLGYFVEPRSTFRTALRTLSKPASAAILLFACAKASAATDIPAPQREDFMRIMVMGDGRVTPLATLAVDFTTTVTGGKTSFAGMDADEVFRRFLFDFGDMKSRPMIRVKSDALRDTLGIDGRYASYDDYMRAISSGRLDIDDPATAAAYPGDIARFEAVNMLVSGEALRIFPVAGDSGVHWYSPLDVPADTDTGLWIFARKSLGCLNEAVATGDAAMSREVIGGIYRFQVKATGAEMPAWRVRLESFYARHGSGVPVMIFCLALGVGLLVCAATGRGAGRLARIVGTVAVAFAFALLTALISIRWALGGHVPLSNGFETMQFMAWCLLLCGVVAGFRRPGVCGVSLTTSGLCLAVAAMSGAGRPVGNLMPVLASPLLSVHVALVMSAYSLLMLLAFNGAAGLMTRDARLSRRLLMSGRALLYPAVFLLAGGIFTGAVWADVSWGAYWSWDPKETWALITMLVYSVAMHPASLHMFARPRAFHAYTLAAFATVLLTYFGVNYWFGGMHSYA